MNNAVRIYPCGGLGNQMFQYALGRALSLRLNAPLNINISAFAKPVGAAHNAWRIPLFPFALGDNICVEAAPPSRHHHIRRRIKLFVRDKWHHKLPIFSDIIIEPHFEYWGDVANVRAPAHLYGYWQSEKYFLDQTDQIRKDFTFPPLPAGEALRVAAHICACPEAVSVHIRRGDYVSNSEALAFHGLLGPEYYRAALAHIRATLGNTTVFLFSDDPQWVRDNFDPCGHTVKVVDLNLPESPQHDMHLMSLCRHHIIANSSFSWWGAWLGSPSGIIVAPKRWFADPSVNTNDIYPPAWARL